MSNVLGSFLVGAKMAIIIRDGIEGKICTKCKSWKPITEFHRKLARGDGYQPTCKVCSNAAVRDHYRRNSDKKREKNRRYREAHREEMSKYFQVYWKARREQKREYDRVYRISNARRESKRVRTWQRANPDKILQYKRSHRQTHREEIRAQQRQWNKANPDKVRANRHRRRMREIGNGGSFSADEWAALKARYNYTCLRCGKREPEITLTPDHIIPVSRSGSSSISNIQPLCGPCNSTKGDKTTDYRPRSDANRSAP